MRVGKRNLAAACLVATLVGLLGLWPHLAFMSEVGEFRYFHGAFDEDTYMLGWMRDTLRSTRLLSGAWLSAIEFFVGPSIDAVFLACDFLLPFLAACAAYFAASQLSASVGARVLIALLLLFANDLFSLGNMAIWGSVPLNLSWFSAIVERFFGANLVPPYETSFLALFRTPEPQLSFALMFLVLGLLVRFARSPGKHDLGLPVLVLTIVLLPFGYTFVTFPVALVAAGSAAMFAVTGPRRVAAAVALALLGGLVLLASSSLLQQGSQSSSGLASALSYSSRLPIVTPAVIASLFLGGAFGLAVLLGKRREPMAFLALGCLLAPALICNQQVVTGVMISARDWERTFNYPALVFGSFAVVATLGYRAGVFRRHWRRVALGGLCSAIAVVVVSAQKRSMLMWMPHNIESVAAARALAALAPGVLVAAQVVLENGGLGPLVQLRTGGADTLLDFYKVGIALVPNMAPEASHADPSPYEQMVFAYWMRTGRTVAEAEQVLRAEIERRGGMFSHFLFSFRDGWYPTSDNRAVRQEELARSVDSIVARYQRYLANAHAELLAHPSLLVSATAPDKLTYPSWVSNEHVGLGQAAGMTMYVYLQRPGSAAPLARTD